jgi:NADH-quinone oxidoreductase subunit C
MTAEEAKIVIEKSLGGKVKELTSPAPRRMFLTVAVEDLPQAWRMLKEEMGFTHLSTITGLDTGSAVQVLYHFAMPGLVLTVKANTDRDKPSVPTITTVYPGGIMYEREIHDILGVDFPGHPDLRTLVLPDDWPEGVRPMRKDWQYDRAGGVIK